MPHPRPVVHLFQLICGATRNLCVTSQYFLPSSTVLTAETHLNLFNSISSFPDSILHFDLIELLSFIWILATISSRSFFLRLFSP